MNKMPTVQKTWQQFCDKKYEKLSILGGWSIVQDIQEVLYEFVIPHLIAIHWYSGFSRPKKYMGHKKNRNI